jgi:hypothetical protein
MSNETNLLMAMPGKSHRGALLATVDFDRFARVVRGLERVVPDLAGPAQ